VQQDVFLFSDSVRNNVSLGDPSCSDRLLREAADKTGAWGFLSRLPGTFDYQVGERGGLLSMGQRQLLAFMRAYVANPVILILDEATSSIDSESEAMITRATRVVTHERTSLVIAHRLATIQNATRIIVLDHGEIKESGTHEELLKKGSWYYQLYQIQFKEKSETTV
jgi:ATP-binding cassette subfamily B protein